VVWITRVTGWLAAVKVIVGGFELQLMPRADACVGVAPLVVVTVVHANVTSSDCIISAGDASMTVTVEDWPANTGDASAVGTKVQEY